MPKAAIRKPQGPAAIAPIEPLRVDTEEAARILGISRSRLYMHIKEGTIRAVKEGGRTLLTLTELRAYSKRTDPAAADARRS